MSIIPALISTVNIVWSYRAFLGALKGHGADSCFLTSTQLFCFDGRASAAPGGRRCVLTTRARVVWAASGVWSSRHHHCGGAAYALSHALWDGGIGAGTSTAGSGNPARSRPCGRTTTGGASGPKTTCLAWPKFLNRGGA